MNLLSGLYGFSEKEVAMIPLFEMGGQVCPKPSSDRNLILFSGLVRTRGSKVPSRVAWSKAEIQLADSRVSDWRHR